MMLSEIAKKIGGELYGDGSIEITGVAGIKEAQEGEITFLANPRYETYLTSTKASAVILAKNGKPALTGKALLISDNPYVSYLKTIELFQPDDYAEPQGVHRTAVIADDVILGDDITVGANAVIEPGCSIGSGTRILPGSYVGFRCDIGAHCLVYPNVTIREDSVIGDRVIIHSGTVVGSDGFGFAPTGTTHVKIPQIGHVVIEDDVEIGSNVSIDRATTGTTMIHRGTKIDNLVQIAHNVVIGEGSIVVAQVGISGSTEIGRNVTLAGQVGVVGHIRIGDNVQVGAQSGVIRDTEDDAIISGYPARDHVTTRKIWGALPKVPDLLKQIARLERRVADLEDGREGTLPS